MSSDLANKTAHYIGPEGSTNRATRHFLYLEIVAGTLAVAYLAYILRSMLILKESMLIHDHFYWGYPIFQCYAENIINGSFPLWNPFTHGGEPFYPAVLQIRLLEPTTLLMIYVWKWFHITDLVSLYNWVNFVQVLIMIFGIYLLFRTLADNIFIRISLIPVLLYSSLMFASFRQPAPLHQFLWVPYIAYFLLKITYHKDYRWHNWFMLAGLLGVNWQSYFFSGTWIFCLFFLLGLLLFRPELLWSVLRSEKAILKLAFTLAIVSAMMLPNVILMLEKDKYVFPVRMIEPSYEERLPLTCPQQYEGRSLLKEHGVVMPYSLIAHTGSFSSIWDFVQMIYPDRNGFVAGPDVKTHWGKPSEAYIYIGLLPWAIALLGLVVGKHELKRLWLVIAIGFGFLMLGPAGGLHRILYYICPPLWFTRHTHGFAFFFLFALLYFYILGFNHIFGSWNDSLFPPDDSERRGIIGTLMIDSYGSKYLTRILSTIIFSGYIICAFSWMTRLHYPNTNYLFLIVLSVFLISWLLRNDLGKVGIYAGLMLGHIAFLLIFCRHDASAIFARTLLLLALPLGLLFGVRKHHQLRKKGCVVLLLLVVFSASLFIDLKNHLRLTDFLHQTQPHPKGAFDVMTDVQKPKLIGPRKTASLSVLGSTIQSLRYTSLVYRQPYMLSPVVAIDPTAERPYPHTVNETARVLKLRRWNSFFLLKNYFKAVNADMPTSALDQMFCVGKPLFQFKQGVVAVSDDDLPPLLNRLGAKTSAQLLAKCVVVDPGDIDDSLADLEMSESECEGSIYVTSHAKADQKTSSGFSFSVKEHEYDSFSIDVVTDKDGILYWSDGFDEGWHASMDGQEIPIYRANVNFKAVILPKGTSHIQFVYDHMLLIGVAVFLVTFGLALALALITRLFSNRTTVPQ
jgi:hypothetical protein